MMSSTSGIVQVFGRRNDGLSTHSDGRRPKSAMAGNRGLGTAVVPQLWGFRRGRRRRCGGTGGRVRNFATRHGVNWVVNGSRIVLVTQSCAFRVLPNGNIDVTTQGITLSAGSQHRH